MSDFHCCQSCGRPGVEPGYSFCGHCSAARCHHCRRTGRGEVCPDCLELIADIGADDYVEPPAREPGSDDIKPNPRHNARWLLWACNKRGRLRDAQAIGRERGFPRNMLRWSIEQVALVTAALVAAKKPR